MGKKKATIEDLAAMIQREFKMVAKKDDVERGFEAVNGRLDRIERLILVDHKRRIERLELEMRDLKDMLAIK